MLSDLGIAGDPGISSVAGFIRPGSTVLNPAVSGMTPWKHPATSLPPTLIGPSVPGLRHSATRNAGTPIASRTAYVPTVTFRCSDHCCERPRSRRPSSNSTGNPTPPTRVATASGPQIHGSAANGIRFSVNSAKPALLNADTAWNTPRYRARPTGSS